MLSHIFVIDDFYAQPEAVREYALEQVFSLETMDTPYAGAQTLEPTLTNDLIKRFEEIIERKIFVDSSENIFGQFRLSRESSRGQTSVHFDQVHWSAIVYLTPISSTINGEVPGTLFYRHRATGLINPQGFQPKTPDNLNSTRAVIEQIIVPDTHKHDAWQIEHSVDFKFNRAVIFRGDSIFHSSGPHFGSCAKSGRLTQHFFFNEASHARLCN